MGSLAYYRLGAVYPRERLREPYPERWRGSARRAALVVVFGSVVVVDLDGDPTAMFDDYDPGQVFTGYEADTLFDAADAGTVFEGGDMANVTHKTKWAGETLTFAFNFGRRRAVRDGATISNPVIEVGPSGLTVGSPTVLVVRFQGVAAGKGVKVTVSGGTPGETFSLTCRVDASDGSILEVHGAIEINAE